MLGPSSAAEFPWQPHTRNAAMSISSLLPLAGSREGPPLLPAAYCSLQHSMGYGTSCFCKGCGWASLPSPQRGIHPPPACWDCRYVRKKEEGWQTTCLDLLWLGAGRGHQDFPLSCPSFCFVVWDNGVEHMCCCLIFPVFTHNCHLEIQPGKDARFIQLGHWFPAMS